MKDFNGKSVVNSNIADLEVQVSKQLLCTKDYRFYNNVTLKVSSSQFDSLQRFYYPQIIIATDQLIERGNRVLFLEMDNRTLKLTGNSCYRFIKEVTVQAGHCCDDVIHLITVSVLPV